MSTLDISILSTVSSDIARAVESFGSADREFTVEQVMDAVALYNEWMDEVRSGHPSSQAAYAAHTRYQALVQHYATPGLAAHPITGYIREDAR